MDSLLESLGVPYLHVLQPNQYVTERRFSAEESAIAIDLTSPYRAPAMEGYPKLVAKAADLEGMGVHIANAVAIFDTVGEIVYSDSCCHLNQYGNELLADFVASRMIEIVSSGRAASSKTQARAVER